MLFRAWQNRQQVITLDVSNANGALFDNVLKFVVVYFFDGNEDGALGVLFLVARVDD